MRYNKRDREAIEVVRSYIDENYNKKILLKTLCRISGLNETKLSKGFQLMFRKRVTQYQIDIRMRKAAELLASDKIVKEVAAEVGYYDSSKFSPHFKKQFGVSPIIYKSQHCA